MEFHSSAAVNSALFYIQKVAPFADAALFEFL